MLRRAGPWFLVGFAAAFAVIALTMTVYAMSPTGQSVTLLPLWRYYLNEWPRAFRLAAPAGPAGSNQAALFTTTLQHLAMSALAGLVVAGAACWRLKSTGSQKKP